MLRIWGPVPSIAFWGFLFFVPLVPLVYFWYRRRREPSCERPVSIMGNASRVLNQAKLEPSVAPKNPTAGSQLGAEGKVHQIVRQRYDAFLVVDVEATCVEGSASFDYPNEIIEWPVCLLRWKDRDDQGRASELYVADEFRSFVKPTWKPQLSTFCKDLTGITQSQVDGAPTFTELLPDVSQFLARNGLLDPQTGERLVRYCWCSDGPFDIRDFVSKQCFISRISMPIWLKGDVLDVRHSVRTYVNGTAQRRSKHTRERAGVETFPLPQRLVLSIPRQLHALGLAPFDGRQHSGIDDARNISRILIELARRGVKLEPNTRINLSRRWPWMGKRGKVLEGYY